MAYRVVTPPVVEPIGIEELRQHLRIDATGQPPRHPEDALIMGYLSAAREHAELYVGFALASQVWELALDAFPCGDIALPGGSVSAIESISYVDMEGMEQFVDPTGFVVDNFTVPNWLLVAQDSAWPAALSVANAVRVRYTVGASPLPASIRTALLIMVGNLYEQREEFTGGADRLLHPHRINLGV